MRKFKKFAAVLLTCIAAVLCADDDLIVSTTIDFLDMAFQSKCKEGYYTLEAYEAFIKRLSEGGIKKINLRTNVIGVTFNKSKYTNQYGTNGAWHYFDRNGSSRLIKTLQNYDPIAETIRLGHKYGMQVWCWENITDEGGGHRINGDILPADAVQANKLTDGYPLVDPFFRTHPSCWATVKPFDFTAVSLRNFRAQQYPIEKISFESYRSDRPAIRFSKNDIDLYYSYDNKNYRRYDKDFEFIPKRVNGKNQLILQKLDIHAPYIKIAPKDQYDPSRNYTLAVKGHFDSGKAWNTKGEQVPIYWGYCQPNAESRKNTMPENYQLVTSLDFSSMPSIAVDHGRHQIGFYVGEVVGNNHLVGVVEFTDPVAMKHKLDKFSELAAYPFDGYSLTLNCHSDGDNPDRFSYHPALRERLFIKTGKDIWKDELPLKRIIEERVEGFVEYVQGCKKLIGDRPIYVYGWRPGDKEYFSTYGRTNMGSINWPYKRLIQEGIVDGIIMYYDFADYFTEEITGGKKFHLGMYACMETGRVRKTLDINVHAKIKGLKELDYYGAVEMNDQRLKMIKDFTDRQKK